MDTMQLKVPADVNYLPSYLSADKVYCGTKYTTAQGIYVIMDDDGDDLLVIPTGCEHLKGSAWDIVV